MSTKNTKWCCRSALFC